jgi:hypothetical protein
LLALVDLFHKRRVGQDREGFLEALQVIGADQDRSWLAVAGEHHTAMLILDAVHQLTRSPAHARPTYLLFGEERVVQLAQLGERSGALEELRCHRPPVVGGA